MPFTITSYYANNGGRIVCPRHMGCAGETAYLAAPERDRYRVPGDTWERVDAEWLAEWYAVTGSMPRCEDCR